MMNRMVAALATLLASAVLSLAQGLPPSNPASSGAPTGPLILPPPAVVAPTNPALPGSGELLTFPRPVPLPHVAEPSNGPPVPIASPAPLDALLHSPVLAASGTLAGANNNAANPGYGGGRFWIGAESMLFWTKDAPGTPALLTTGTTQSGGIIGARGTSFLFIETPFYFGNAWGGRLRAGGWLNCDWTVGMEASGFLTEEAAAGYGFSSDSPTTPLLTRPFINALTGQESGAVVASPGSSAGGVTIVATERFWGTELNGLFNLCRSRRSDTFSLDALAGFRYIGLEEHLNIHSEQSSILTGSTTPFNGGRVRGRNTIAIDDRFATYNNFFGGQLGGRLSIRVNRLAVELMGEVALGDMHELKSVAGFTSLTVPGQPTVSVPGGLLALSTNSGHFGHDGFAIVPEAGFTVNYQLTCNVSAYFGYTFLALSEVARASDLVTRTLNPTQIPSNASFGRLVGPAVPAPIVQQADFWAHSLNLGLVVNF